VELSIPSKLIGYEEGTDQVILPNLRKLAIEEIVDPLEEGAA